MPFKSIKQRKFMWAKHPDIARRWTNKYGSKIGGKNVRRKATRKKIRRRRRK